METKAKKILKLIEDVKTYAPGDIVDIINGSLIGQFGSVVTQNGSMLAVLVGGQTFEIDVVDVVKKET